MDIASPGHAARPMLLLCVVLGGCARDGLGATDPDLGTSTDGATAGMPDLPPPDLITPSCLDPNRAPDCRTANYGPRLPLRSDPQPDPTVWDRLIGRDF